MSDDWQLDSEPSSAPVIIEDYRGPIIEQPRPYPSHYELAPVFAPPISREREPYWIDVYRNPEQRGWLPRWVKRRLGDDPLLYAAARAVGRMFIVVLLLGTAVLAGVAGYDKPVSSIANSGFAHFDDGIDLLRYLAAMAITYSMLISIRGLFAGFRLRRNYWRSANPQLAGRLSWLALDLAALLSVAAAIGAFFILSYYLQHGT